MINQREESGLGIKEMEMKDLSEDHEESAKILKMS